jgi:thiamine-monophosphate kinase
MASTELSRIERLSKIFALEGGAGAKVIVGIGDDAAVLAASEEPLVWTVDAAVEGVHFRREWLSFEDIGFRSMMAAVSDLGAKGAEPLGVLSALVLPEDVGDAELEALARGQQEAVRAVGTAVIGGNLAAGRELSITTTALGRAPRAIARAGARPGDALWLIGAVGLAAAGLRWLMEGRAIEGAAPRACVEAWRRPRARVAEGLSLRGVATAAIDVSDGLARDVGHLAAASGVRAVIDAGALESGAPWSAELADTAAQLGARALDLALFGGEDYAIAFTAPPGASVRGAFRIGSIEAADEGSGVFALRADGFRERLREGGFDHFAR